ncbi:MAG: TraB/GumN family protein [Candidatus Thermoplasmatota archaeon]|nr:TraB/GumN family protein [Candidatus Thermoplasmatota archaeon]
MMITLVGIGHVFSIKEAVKYIVLTRRPDAVCLELDRLRFDALETGTREQGEAPFLFRRLQRIYDKAAETQGAQVGEEMLGAAEAAGEIGIPHYFIDIEASPMVMNIFQKLSMSEKLKLFGSVIGASIIPKKTLEEGIKEIGEDPDKYMEQFENYFPTLKRDIVDYRDRYMSKRLIEISKKHEHILAVVGQGHIRGMIDLLEPYGAHVINLKEVQEIARGLVDGSIKMPVPKGGNIYEGSNNDVHFGFNVEMETSEEI